MERRWTRIGSFVRVSGGLVLLGVAAVVALTAGSVALEPLYGGCGGPGLALCRLTPPPPDWTPAVVMGGLGLALLWPRRVP